MVLTRLVELLCHLSAQYFCCLEHNCRSYDDLGRLIMTDTVNFSLKIKDEQL